MMIYICGYMILISIATFLLFAIDKYKAKKGLWRISEKTLLTLTMLGGGLGALLGIEIFHHKTIKGSFLWKMRFLLIIWIVLIISLLSFL